MAIRPGVCQSYLREILRGEHRPEHTYMVALYTDNAELSPRTTGYGGAGEVVGLGYEKGGIKLSGFSVSGDDSARLDFSSTQLERATIHADGGLIYNATIGKAVAVFKFNGTVASTNAPFYIDLPSPGEDSLIRIS